MDRRLQLRPDPAVRPDRDVPVPGHLQRVIVKSSGGGAAGFGGEQPVAAGVQPEWACGFLVGESTDGVGESDGEDAGDGGCGGDGDVGGIFGGVERGGVGVGCVGCVCQVVRVAGCCFRVLGRCWVCLGIRRVIMKMDYSLHFEK